MDMPVTTLDEIDYDVARRAYQHVSFTPEKRATQEQESYVAEIVDVWDTFYAEAEKNGKLDVLYAAVERYKAKYKELVYATLRSKANTASTMITGGSNFNVARNDKANNAYMRKIDALLEFREKARKAIAKQIAIQPPPKQVDFNPIVGDGWTIQYGGDDRLWIVFDDIPEPDMRAKLKSRAFKFSPTRSKATDKSVYVRQFTSNAILAARDILA